MLRPIADIKPFTSYPISNRLVMGEDNQSAPVSSHQILSGHSHASDYDPNVYRVSSFESGEDYLSGGDVSSLSVDISSGFTLVGPPAITTFFFQRTGPNSACAPQLGGD